MTRSRVPQQATAYNLITTIMLILTLGVALGVAYLAFNAPSQGPQVGEQPTAFVLATATPTLPGPTMNATWTASPTITVTFTPTITRTPTEPPATFTATASKTPTITPTSTASLTPTLTPTVDTTRTTNTPIPTATTGPATAIPTATPTRATSTPTLTPTTGLIYGQRGTTTYTAQTINGQGCNWIGLAGQVFNKSNQPVTGLTIHVFNSAGIEYFTTSGSNTAYGASGWEQLVSSTGEWFVEILDSSNKQISTRVTVNVQSDCTKNLAIVNFEQK